MPQLVASYKAPSTRGCENSTALFDKILPLFFLAYDHIIKIIITIEL